MLRSRAFLSLNLAHFFDHFVLLILPTAALATGADYAGSLSPGTWAFAAFALATLPAGWLGDRWGRVAMMRVYLVRHRRRLPGGRARARSLGPRDRAWR